MIFMNLWNGNFFFRPGSAYDDQVKITIMQIKKNMLKSQNQLQFAMG